MAPPGFTDDQPTRAGVDTQVLVDRVASSAPWSRVVTPGVYVRSLYIFVSTLADVATLRVTGDQTTFVLYDRAVTGPFRAMVPLFPGIDTSYTVRLSGYAGSATVSVIAAADNVATLVSPEYIGLSFGPPTPLYTQPIPENQYGYVNLSTPTLTTLIGGVAGRTLVLRSLMIVPRVAAPAGTATITDNNAKVLLVFDPNLSKVGLPYYPGDYSVGEGLRIRCQNSNAADTYDYYATAVIL